MQKNGSKWPTNNHVSGLTLSRQCVHTLRWTENKHRGWGMERGKCQVSLVQYTYLLVNTAPTQRRVLLKERGK